MKTTATRRVFWMSAAVALSALLLVAFGTPASAVFGTTLYEWDITYVGGNGNDIELINVRSSIVPEPSTIALAGFGAFGFIVFAWRQRRRLTRAGDGPRSGRRLARIATLAGLLFLATTGPALAVAVKIGVMGDSVSDEYAEQSYGAYSQNWVEQLVAYRGIDFGPTATAASQPGGTWNEPRRTGYEYNWARYAATSASLLTQGQDTGLAAQIGPNEIDYAVMMIGANDWFLDGNDAYENIYNGSWSPAQIDTWVDGVAANINTALDTVLPTGVPLVLVGPVDYGLAQVVQDSYPSVAGRQAVADVLFAQFNPAIEAIAASRNLPYVNMADAGLAIFGPHDDLNLTLTLGGVDILLQENDNFGDNPTAAFVHDGRHLHSSISGFIGNLVLEGLNIGYGANLSLFSEAELLAHQNLAYGGSDTLESQIGPYSDFVINYVPEPSTGVLAVLAFGTVLWWRRRRK